MATFEEIDLGDVYGDLTRRLLTELPEGLRQLVSEVFAVLDEKRWPYADFLARSRYLLTIRHNEFDAATAGAALFGLGLVPDFTLFDDRTQIRRRVERNLNAMTVLSRRPGQGEGAPAATGARVRRPAQTGTTTAQRRMWRLDQPGLTTCHALYDKVPEDPASAPGGQQVRK
ncbi:hypothetical protein ACQPZP_05185 [Spirillospora sp. CA-142024]|uniref:hypothetical protein n=1 Tax=Spirillospora sp. CA-142024 TaxID=3240036 RepID=UPI003D8F91A9